MKANALFIPRFFFPGIALLAVAVANLASVARAQTAAPTSKGAAVAVRNIVLVHGAFADGSGWRGVYDELTGRGYRVSIVQNPLTSLADDVAATRRVLKRQDGPVILVGHSYGGTVITEVGNDPEVAGLVYVAALAPDAGESTGEQFAEIPAPPGFVIEPQSDGFGFVNAAKFKSGFAGDISDADAAFLRDAQVPIAMSAFNDKVTRAAWRTKPSWFVVATEDGAIDPKLLRKTAQRIGAVTEEVKGSHVVFFSQPKAVADVIDRAARGVSSPEPAGKGKLKHVGLVWLKNPGNVAERQQIIDALHRFAREIPEVRGVSVGQPHPSPSKLVDSTFDVCFTMQFDDQAALDRYSKNPVHQKAAEEAFLPLSQKIQFYDFITE